MCRLCNGKLFLRPEATPRRLDYPRAMALREFNGAVNAAGINDDDLIAKGHAFQAFLKL